MEQTDTSKALRIAQIVLALLTAIAAALLIYQCADIYRAGTDAANMTDAGVRINDIYSAEIVAQRFSRISWALYAWLAALAAVLILRARGAQGPKETMSAPLKNRLELVRAGVQLTPEMEKEERRRKTASAVCAAVCALSAVMIGLYVFNRGNFVSRDLEPVIGAMLRWVLPWTAAGLAAIAAMYEVWRRSALRELEAAKSAPRAKREPRSAKQPRYKTAVRAALIIAAIALIVAGALNGGIHDVLTKATNICTECVGLG